MRVRPSGRRAATVFYIVNVLLFPLTLIGYVTWLARIYLVGRASGASISAQGPLSARAEVYPEVVDRPAGEERGVPSWLLKPGG